MPPTGAGPVNSALCVANITTPLCDTVNMLLPAKFFIIKMSLILLLISSDPVITALPLNGNAGTLLSAYDAVTA